MSDDRVTRSSLDTASGERFQRLRRDLDVSSFGLNLMLLRPGQRHRIHAHAHQEEVYLVWEGIATVVVENAQSYELRRGDLLRIGPDARRQLTNRHDALLAVIALGGSAPHDARDGRAFNGWDEHEASSPADVPLPEDLPASEIEPAG